MLQLILMMTLIPQQAPSVANTPITTCQWPNTCVTEAARPVTTCQWPNTCADATEGPEVTTCQYPNPCS